MSSLLIVATAASIIVFLLIVTFIHHGIIHPEIDDPVERWLDSKDFWENFNRLGSSHGGVILALLLILLGVAI